MESGENNTIPQTEHKFLQSMLEATQWPKQLFANEFFFKVLLKPQTERMEERKMSFVKKTQACTKKPQAKHKRKLKAVLF